ncbi:hypothetical protein V1477_014056 [Vespula maculifrons]|uniref:Uncharacterized protein n=1 Tax=Vespula maculifrons TaxID=7453 RepID=A0ABD2BLH5_VESMC
MYLSDAKTLPAASLHEEDVGKRDREKTREIRNLADDVITFESHGVTVDNGTLKVGPTNPAKSADAWRTLKILRAHSALCKSTVGKWVPCAKRSHSKASFWQGYALLRNGLKKYT